MHSRLRKLAQGWSVKLRTAQGDHWFPLNIDPAAPDVAEDRRKRLQRLANLLKAANRGATSREILLEAAAERAEKAFRQIEVAIEGFSPDAVAAERGPTTFREVGEYYASGRFQDDFPDSVKKRKGTGSLALSETRLEVFYPVLGTLTFDRITDDLVEKAKRRIPKVEPNTRRAYVLELRRILRIAARPLKLVPAAIELDIPPKAPRKAFTFLYPANEYKLISSGRPPFARRFFYAWLARNGERIEEALQITWGHIDLVNGIVRVEAGWTKTGVARFWQLDDDVLEALRLRRDSLKPALGERVFVSPSGRPMNRRSVLRWMQEDLRAVGLDKDRPELLDAGEGGQGLRIHDLGRGTCVTLLRAMGRPDRWIMDRTGHESVQSLELYDRVTRHARERNLGWLAPMGRALGMRGAVSIGPRWAEGQVYGLATDLATPTENEGFYLGKLGAGSVLGERHRASITEENRQKSGAPESLETPVSDRGQRGSEVVGQSSGQVDEATSAAATHGDSPVEQALAYALRAATDQGRWDVVLEVTRELSERRRARVAPQVPSLEEARRKREKGEGK